METEIIKPHKFEDAKNKIQRLAHNVPSTVTMQQFPTEGSIFSWNDHNITGNEINSMLVSPLQSTLIAHNSNIRALFNALDEIYKAFESLDKEYIAGIVGSVKAAKIASDQAHDASAQALVASNKAIDATKKAESAQADIKKTIEGLKVTVQILKDFKEKVTRELAIISSLNAQAKSIKDRVQKTEQEEGQTKISLKSLENKLKSIDSKNTSILELAKQLQSIMSCLNKLSHLKDVDTIWNDVDSNKNDLAEFHKKVDVFIGKVNQSTEHIQSDIEALQQYRTTLESYEHLSEVDTIWSDVDSNKNDLAEFHKKIDVFISEVNTTHDEIRKSIKKLEEENEKAHIRYDKHIRIAYCIGGTALGLSILNYVFQLIGLL